MTGLAGGITTVNRCLEDNRATEQQTFGKVQLGPVSSSKVQLGPVRHPHLRQPVAWKKTSESTLLLLMRSGPVVYGRITFSIRAGRAVFTRSGLRLSTDDMFHSRPGRTGWNTELELYSSVRAP